MITNQQIIAGAKFQTKSGIIWNVDSVSNDIVRTSMAHGSKGNYPDSIDDVVSFLNEECATEMNIISVNLMKYVVQCYISDMRGSVILIKDFTQEQLNAAFQKACEFYGDILPTPDNGRYEDYVLA